ncbi:MAG: hypothetical protein H8D35_07880 [Nitrosopumilus sp.]|nr:hypothetical protein [Nitrosopumilus sp.]
MICECCNDKPKFLITYNVGPDESQWKVCEKHFNEDVLFQKNIKEKKVMEGF